MAEKTVPSGLAALLVASIPLWVVLLRRSSGERISARSLVAVLVGFGGVALLVHPEGEATIIGLLACIFAAFMWAVGSFASPRISLPRDPLVSTAWQSLLGGLVIVTVGLVGGEAGDVDFDAFSGRSIFGLIYLITFGSLLAFTCYAWLLQNAPISKVSTYAYVNPVVAIALGWLILDEGISLITLVGAGDHRRLGRTRHPGRSARNATCGNPARSIGPISSKPRRRMTAWDGRLVVIVQARISVRARGEALVDRRPRGLGGVAVAPVVGREEPLRLDAVAALEGRGDQPRAADQLLAEPHVPGPEAVLLPVVDRLAAGAAR